MLARPCRCALSPGASICAFQTSAAFLRTASRCPPIPSYGSFDTRSSQFAENLPFKEDFESAGGRVVRQPTGHLVFYRPDGRRILATDPSGHALHESAWGLDDGGKVALLRARMKLDWGAWVGLKPSGLINETSFNLTTRPGWQRLTADDLRAMAAQALRVPIEDIRWFYRDEDLVDQPDWDCDDPPSQRCTGMSLKKEVSMESASCLAWARCTGSQSIFFRWSSCSNPYCRVPARPRSNSSVASTTIRMTARLHHRRFGIVGSLPIHLKRPFAFSKVVSCLKRPPGKDALSLFMDPTKSHQVEWFPSPTPPRRYFDHLGRLLLDGTGWRLQKVTLVNDSAGLPYMNPKGRGISLCDRTAQDHERTGRHERSRAGNHCRDPLAGRMSRRADPISFSIDESDRLAISCFLKASRRLPT